MNTDTNTPLSAPTDRIRARQPWNGVTPTALKNAKQSLDTHGFVVLEGFLKPEDLSPIHDAIRALISARREQVGLRPVRSDMRFDDGLMELATRRRQDVGPIYDACRRLIAVHRLAAREDFEAISRHLMGTQNVMLHREKQVRIDLPRETKFLFDWHQDFPYAQDSEDALVYWIPLHAVDETNGCLKVRPGSHRLGVQSTLLNTAYASDASKSKSHAIELTGESAFAFPEIAVPMNAGDVLVIHTLVVHKSGQNLSDRARWTAMARHANFDDKWAVQNGWPSGIADEKTATKET